MHVVPILGVIDQIVRLDLPELVPPRPLTDRRLITIAIDTIGDHLVARVELPRRDTLVTGVAEQLLQHLMVKR